MNKKPFPIKKSDIARSFSLATKSYDQHAIIQKEIGNRLLTRLQLIKTAPKTILDVGAGTGFLTRKLQETYPQSRIIGLDLAKGMTHFAKAKQTWHLWKNKPLYICGDTECLPFANNSVDLIFSNFTFQWCFDLNHVFAECKRVLKPNGTLFFSTLGPHTLFELKESWAQVDDFTHVNDFVDLHDIGDVLLSAGFSDPVMDMEMITLTYPQVKVLLQDLKATGAHNIHENRLHGCTPKSHLKKMLQAYDAFKRPDLLYPATFEVIYGHAINTQKAHYGQDADGLVRIPGDKIPILKE